MDVKLPFGLKNGEIIDISKVVSGLKCECVCPNCKSPLIARKGSKTIHHFAHYKAPECKFAYETAIHLMSKKIFEKHKRIKVPEVEILIGKNYFKHYTLYYENYVNFDLVTTEKKLENIVPDIILEVNGKKLLVEIAVTHFIDDSKNKKIHPHKFSTIEIDLSKEKRDINEEYLTEILIDKLDNKKWIYNAKWNLITEKVKKFAEPFKLVQRSLTLHIDDCPIKSRIWKGKIYANFYDDCQGCTYYFGERGYNEIYCTGNHKNTVDEILNHYIKKGSR